MKILLVCCDDSFEDMFADLVPEHELDVIGEYRAVKDMEHMFGILQHDSYDLLVLTNMGIPSPVAQRHISMLPEVRTCRVLLMTAHITPEVEQTCERQNVELVRLPASGDALVAAVDGTPEKVTRSRARARRTV